MRDDNRLDYYFSARAAGIELPPAGIASVMDRAARRHRHRRAAVSACTAVAVLTGALSVANLGGAPGTEQLVARPAGVVLVDSSLGWHVVTPKVGLSWAQSTVVGPDHAVYSLSTAPGAAGNEEGPSPAVLYRSADGIEWAPTALPENLSASSLATSDELLYAIGTAPAGGTLRSVHLASTDASGAPWSQATLPINVATLEARFGVHLGLNRLTVASNGKHIVAAVRVQVDDGFERILPPGVDMDQGFSFSETGLHVYAKPEALDRNAEALEIAKRLEPVLVASYTWEQLGIDPVLRSLILGETRAFVSDDGTTFAETSLPNPVRTLGALLATADGFTLLGSTNTSEMAIESWTSSDGRSWASGGGPATPGFVLASGTRRDRVTVVIGGRQLESEQSDIIKVQQGDDTWTELRVTDLVRRTGVEGEFYASGAAVGPLGAAVVVTQYGPDETHHSYLVTTADGIEASVIDLTPLVGDGFPDAVRVTADAITVTVTGSGADTPVQLLVGTPKR